MWYVYTETKVKLARMCEFSQVYVIKSIGDSVVVVYFDSVIHFKTNVKSPFWQTNGVRRKTDNISSIFIRNFYVSFCKDSIRSTSNYWHLMQ